MRLGRKKEDPATRKLEDEGLLRLRTDKKSRINKEKLRKFGRITFDFWGGVKYILVLSVLLWWIPLFGPMIAGYVGGRRTGGPKKGLLASIVSLSIIGTIYYVLTHGLLPVSLEQIISYPVAMVSALEAHSAIGPYVEFIKQYWSSFFARVIGGIPFEANSYVLTIIFAYVGGIISLEKRKEYFRGLSALKSKAKKRRRRTKSSRPISSSRMPTSGRSLKDMRAVKLKSPSTGKRDKRSESRSEKRPNVSFGQDRSFSNRAVSHNSGGGDDWELL